MIKKIRILLADDTLIARDGWKKILAAEDFVEVVGESKTAQEIDERMRETNPDVLLMDLKWFGDASAGWIVLRKIKKSFTNVRVIVITAHEKLASVAQLAGADAVLLKTFTREELLSTIRELASGEINTKKLHSI